jgi:hypothetical protein
MDRQPAVLPGAAEGDRLRGVALVLASALAGHTLVDVWMERGG